MKVKIEYNIYRDLRTYKETVYLEDASDMQRVLHQHTTDTKAKLYNEQGLTVDIVADGLINTFVYNNKQNIADALQQKDVDLTLLEFPAYYNE